LGLARPAGAAGLSCSDHLPFDESNLQWRKRKSPRPRLVRAGRSSIAPADRVPADAMPPARSSRAVPPRSSHATPPSPAGRPRPLSARSSGRKERTDALRPGACRRTGLRTRTARSRRRRTGAEGGRSCLAAFSLTSLPALPADRVLKCLERKIAPPTSHRARARCGHPLPRTGERRTNRHRDATPRRRRVYTSPPPPVNPYLRSSALTLRTLHPPDTA
jgi:hypothetical protein